MENKKIEIVILENIPKLNTLYKTSKYGKIYKSQKGKSFCENFKNIIKLENLIETDIKVTIEMSVKRNCDIDCLLKCLLDAMNGNIYKDDMQITELNVKKHLVKDKKDVKTFINIFW